MYGLALGALAVAGANTCGTQVVAGDAGVVFIMVYPVRTVRAGGQALVGGGQLALWDHHTDVLAPEAHLVSLASAAIALLVAGPADLAGSFVVVKWTLSKAGRHGCIPYGVLYSSKLACEALGVQRTKACVTEVMAGAAGPI